MPLTHDAPGGVEAALELVAGFDDALGHGFARVGEEQAAALRAFGGALAATPLGSRAGEAAEKVAAGSVSGDHLTALAAGRAALTGAVHDALLAGLDAALGRDRAEWTAATGTGEAENLLGGALAWLHELAITGWRGVGQDLVSASDQVIEALLADPGKRRLAVLLDGLAAELRAVCPLAPAVEPPARRWADLWTRAVLLSRGIPEAGPAEEVTGRLLVLGADVHEHGTAVQVRVHGVLERGEGTPDLLVRTSVAAAKVDTIIGPAVWKLLAGFPVLLTALAERRALEVTGMPLLPGGDLVWHEDRARTGEEADPFTVARVRLATAAAPAVPPLDRHPVAIAEPILLEGYTARAGDGGTVFELGDLTLDVMSGAPCGPITADLAGRSTACVGLVLWDAGRWRLRPLAVQATVKRATVTACTGDWALGPTDPKVAKAEAKSDAVAVLRERAGRLLRK
ncbi:hypothetical protein [Bailinhaonella thermotolerans]|uniref:Uncharacterized protein n=1 Tax=Bailinhaonella thermotolerans TaxID=1070861 RepID=A0A3A4AVZ5_9ACTN|nr:hypothetical protein [Bailinhaonella thermotolerans]RJL32901.1 hypothetical protein D5H75_14930 [Bailinhaonella thermotolerans]